MRKLLLLLLSVALPALGQANQGELHLSVADPSGLAIKAVIRLESEANHYTSTLTTNAQGRAVAARLPFGRYHLELQQAGFAEVSEFLDVRSTIPVHYTIQLKLSSVKQSVTVSASDTLIDPDQAGSVDQIRGSLIQNRLGSIPGRSLQDLVNSQPGWLYEGNAVLHPRGSEYQTQFVVDGIPLIDNRSPGFGPEIEADDAQSVTIYTAGIPAEYGRKMGGVVEVNTLQDAQPGFHGQAVLSGGSFDTAGAFAQGQYAWGRNTLGGSSSGSRTDHYLNPVVPQNYSNTGTQGDFSLNFRRDFTLNDQISLSLRHELARYDIPNEFVQQAAGQRQNADSIETMGAISYQHIFSGDAIGDLRGMVRDNTTDFTSNPESTPIEVFQHNGFREGYFKASVTIDRGHNEWKAGVESDNLFLNEKLNYLITDPTQFDPGSPLTFAYQANRPDLEQSVFLQDQIRLHNWTINAGLRWDHYQLLLNNQALQPRLAISHYFPSAETVLHFSYDRVFQTPSFENILLSSSGAVTSIDPTGFLSLPVRPSQGDYYEAGLTWVFLGHLKIGSNYFRRVVDNYADDSQIFNTSISFPISFRKGIVYGAEGKVEIPDWRHFSGFGSYSYTVGNVWFPVTGGLFFGSNAAQAASQLTGHTPDSQDQRNTVRGRIRYQLTPRLWTAFGLQYDTGLPFDFDGDASTVLQEYGPQVLSRINFTRGRIYPAFQANASAGADIYKSDRINMHLQVDGQNLNNILNVIDFGGLFSGNAIGPSRSFDLRLTTSF
ncbi:TonB-dependent receptor [Acidicapsa acidisoli]|uniref:TonB-dependent receptor n=1 Tax=Acidicapsa acidisoli TaxID=1615681 RepID=UPI0021E07BE4|nr:TonB-dependent receptor [Acidicapsa acidisoli]